MNIQKAIHILAEHTPGKGVGQIPPEKIGDAVKTIAGYGCDSIILSYADPTPQTDADKSLQEPCDAAGIQLIANCSLHGWVPPTWSEMHDTLWYTNRIDAWMTWANFSGFGTRTIWDFELYRKHLYAKFRNIAWPQEYIDLWRSMVLLIPHSLELGWCFSGQNENKLGHAFIGLCEKAIGLDGEFDDASGAWKNDPKLPAYDPSVHTKQANPAPDKFPPWFPMGKIIHSRRWCSLNGDWICPGSVWQRTWKFVDAPDGVLYSADDQLLSNLGLT